MSHYEELGVADSATPAEVRVAYVRLARRAHPDVAGEEGAAQMRRINAAWAALGSESSRKRYDAELALQRAGHSERLDADRRDATARRRRVTHEPFVVHPDFIDDEGNDDWRFEPDVGDPATAPGRFLQMFPPALFVAAVLLTVVGLMTGLAELAAVGLGLVVVAGISFLFVPLVAMSRAVASERRD